MYMVSMITNYFSVRGFGHPVFLKPHFGHPVMKILAKTLSSSNISSHLSEHEKEIVIGPNMYSMYINNSC